MHLQLIEKTQAMVDEENFDASKFDLKIDCEWSNAKIMDVWQDEQTMIVLNGGQIPTERATKGVARIRKKKL
jgi:frataxin-like iron-binding protein CyaY